MDAAEGWGWLRYASIPLVAALIGWVTNWVAITISVRLKTKGETPCCSISRAGPTAR